MDKNIRLAIMQRVRFGLMEGRVRLRFSAYTEECGAADYYLEGAEIIQVIQDSKVSDVRELEMYPCFVEDLEASCLAGARQRFVRVWRRP